MMVELRPRDALRAIQVHPDDIRKIEGTNPHAEYSGRHAVVTLASGERIEVSDRVEQITARIREAIMLRRPPQATVHGSEVDA